MAREDAAPRDVRVRGPFPIHRGPFLFGPHFLSEAAWSAAFEPLIKKVLTQANVTAQVFCGSGDRYARIDFSIAEMVIDGKGGMFAVNQRGDWCSADDDLSHWGGPLGPPRQFFRELDEVSNIAHLGPDYHNVRRFALPLHDYMERRFQRALEEGIAQVTACLEMPSARQSSGTPGVADDHASASGFTPASDVIQS